MSTDEINCAYCREIFSTATTMYVQSIWYRVHVSFDETVYSHIWDNAISPFYMIMVLLTV